VSDFFHSPIVREALQEIQDLQEKLMTDVMSGMLIGHGPDKQQEQIDVMRSLIEKQKNFIFRLNLTDDPKALEMKEQIMQSAQMLGMKEGENINDFFDKLGQTLDRLEQTIDREP